MGFFWEPRRVEGTPYVVRPASGALMFSIKDEPDDFKQMCQLLAECVVDADHNPMMGAERWGEQPYPLLKHLEQIALEVNGLADSPIEDASGN